MNNVEEIKERYKEIVALIDELREYELPEEEFNELLDETNDTYIIGNLDFSPSMILYRCDPIAYNIGLGEEEGIQKNNLKERIEDEINDFVGEFEKEEIKEEIENLNALLEEAY